jgi:hypothetical protein
MPDIKIDTYFMRRMVKYLEETSINPNAPGYVNLMIAKNKIIAAIIEIEDN